MIMRTLGTSNRFLFRRLIKQIQAQEAHQHSIIHNYKKDGAVKIKSAKVFAGSDSLSLWIKGKRSLSPKFFAKYMSTSITAKVHFVQHLQNAKQRSLYVTNKTTSSYSNYGAQRADDLIFYADNDGFVARKMNAKDIEIVKIWQTSVGITPENDLLFCVNAFPEETKFVMFEYKGKPIGSTIVIPWGESIYYGSLHYVLPEYRRKGFGEKILAFILNVGNNVLCLDTMGEKVTDTVLKKDGFSYKFITTRYSGFAKQDYGYPYSGYIKSAKGVDFEDVIDYDNKCFISENFLPRRNFLKQLINEPNVFTNVALDKENKLEGIGILRPSTQVGVYIVGPLYAETLEVASEILQSLLKNIVGSEFVLDIWQPNEGSRMLIERFGMTLSYDMSRLHSNGDAKELKKSVFAITSTEVCGF